MKQVLNSQKHYGFKMFIKSKAEEYGTHVYDVKEDYTSQTCTKCGMLSKKYDKNRMKECENRRCKYKIDRDINGSRNILLKCGKEIIKEKSDCKVRKEEGISPGQEPLT